MVIGISIILIVLIIYIYCRLVTISEATKSMSAFTQLDDSVLKSHDDDPEV